MGRGRGGGGDEAGKRAGAQDAGCAGSARVGVGWWDGLGVAARRPVRRRRVVQARGDSGWTSTAAAATGDLVDSDLF